MINNPVKQIRTFIADDHNIVRAGVCLLLESEQDIIVVGEASTGEEALDLIEKCKPDVVLMDIAMPGIDGLEATRQIKKNWPEISVLVLTMHRSNEYFFEVLKSGASGYILKAGDTSELISAVRTVSKREVYLHPKMTKMLVQKFLGSIEGNDNYIRHLSHREKEIIRLIAEGYTTSEIADQLVLSPSTIQSHKSNIMKKLKLNNRQELIKFAIETGF